jgi:hypothetical protein
MECQDGTAHLGDYLAGSLPVEEVDALLAHAATCAVCRDKLIASEPGSRFDAVLADYQEELGGGPRNIRRLSRCATCHFPGQSCSWICRRRFTERRAV